MKHRIGVFDSGVGGLTTLTEIKRLLPNEEYFYIGDHANNPYGEKTAEELTTVTVNVVRRLKRRGVELVVVACNTATTRCIRELRRLFPEITFVGTEPAIKLACDRGFEKILLLATPNTTKSSQVADLIQKYSTGKEVKLFPCEGLARIVEDELAGLLQQQNEPAWCPLELCDVAEVQNAGLRFRHAADQVRQNQTAWEKIARLGETQQTTTDLNNSQALGDCKRMQTCLDGLVDKIERLEQYDAVILGCTHYVYLRPMIQRKFPQATLLDGNYGVARRVQSLLYN